MRLIHCMLMARRCAHFVLFGIWSVALCAGWYWMAKYQYASDSVHENSVAILWPPESKLGSTPSHPTLVLFLHPRCPCSRASLAELERLIGKLQKERTTLPNLAVVATVP